MRVVGAAGFLVVVLVDRLLFGFSGASGHFGSVPLVAGVFIHVFLRACDCG
jgi:hypothetical protein